MNEVATVLKNWIPYKLIEEGNSTSCRWMHLGNERIIEPFFEETIAKCRKLPANSNRLKPVSSIDILPEWSQQLECAAPAAVIFHISRCGSTLISQLLSLQLSNIVLSEVPFFDELLRWGYKNKSMEPALPILKAAIKFCSVKPDSNSQRLIIKADSWHIHFYRQFRELFPTTPFILLFRKPYEVIKSQQKHRGMQSVPGLIDPGIFGFNKENIAVCSPDEYMAMVIESYLKAFIEIIKTDQLAFPFNYHEGAIQIVSKIANVACLNISDEETEAMRLRCGFHAKYPRQIYSEIQSDNLHPAFLNKAVDLYNDMEEIRTARF